MALDWLQTSSPSIWSSVVSSTSVTGTWTWRPLGPTRVVACAAAVALARAGRNVVVATGTASGKSLCYQLPVFDALLGDGHRSALYLSPTKALARDQLRG